MMTTRHFQALEKKTGLSFMEFILRKVEPHAQMQAMSAVIDVGGKHSDGALNQSWKAF